MKKILVWGIILLSIVYTFSKLGYYFDISQKPHPSDIMVSLGGDNGLRIKKTLELYDANMSKSGKIILTGVDDFDESMKIYELEWRAMYLAKKGIDIDNIVFNAKAKNTLEEIVYIKHYMLEHDYSSVMFVTDAPHSRRIAFFASEVAHYEEHNLSFEVVATTNEWWHKEHYYTNPDAVIFVMNESVKLAYYTIQNLLGNIDAE